MPTLKLDPHDLDVPFGVPGAKKATGTKIETTALPLALLFALSRRRGGGGGAPAELGLPHAPSAAPAPISARSTSTQYA